MKVINKSYHYLYKTVNTVTGQEYIGARSTDTSIDKDTYLGSGKYLKRSIAKYGRDKFTKTTLKTFNSSLELYKEEQKIVNNEYINLDNTFNIKEGGFGGGSPRTPETRAKMSKTRSGKKHSQKHCDSISKAKTGIATNTGIKWTEESKQKLSKSKKGLPGRARTKEEKIKISETMKAKSQSIVICPHCEKEGNVVNMRRWHFNNCKTLNNGTTKRRV